MGYARRVEIHLKDLRSRIYCHRGLWERKEDANTTIAIAAAVEHGMAIETDIRDLNGKIVISHDAPSSPNNVVLDLLKLNVTTALNLKSDGLLKLDFPLFQQLLKGVNSFAFDGSIPEMLNFRKANLPHALRISEYEQELPWETPYIWLDAFNSDWWIDGELLNKLSEKHFVVVVSPELHGRQHLKVWDKVIQQISNGNPNLGVCTDLPDEFLGAFQ